MASILSKVFKRKKDKSKDGGKKYKDLQVDAFQQALQSREWTQGDGVRQLPYESYEEYVKHQKAKLGKLMDAQQDRLMRKLDRFREVLKERVTTSGYIKPGSSVLCIAARLGTECQAFIEAGCFAIGIDLNPGEENRYVVTGDFHHLQFADNSVDAVYTNSLDHAFQLEKVFAEVRRVLKPGGHFMAEIVCGSQEENGRDPGAYEAVWWDNYDVVVKQIESAGFEVKHREEFSIPWHGGMVIFEKK